MGCDWPTTYVLLRAVNFTKPRRHGSPRAHHPHKMLSRKPTAVKLTQEDLQDYDNLVAEQQQQQSPSPSEDGPSRVVRTSQKGKEVATTAQSRQVTMDERIGITATGTRVPRR